MAERMKGITCCGDCVQYDWKKHRCKRGFCKEYDPRAHFFDDCDLPDVQPVVHGRWLTKEYMPGDLGVGIKDMWIERRAEQSDFYAYCSECKKDAGYRGEQSLILSKFCPNCGARMDLEEG